VSVVKGGLSRSCEEGMFGISASLTNAIKIVADDSCVDGVIEEFAKGSHRVQCHRDGIVIVECP